MRNSFQRSLLIPTNQIHIKMKNLKYISLLFIALFLFSCSSDESSTPQPVNEVSRLTKIKDIIDEAYTIELYSETGVLEQGYNAISLRIKDNTTAEYISNSHAHISWKPVMQMTAMQHACPYSEVMPALGKQTLFNGYIVFQMAQNQSEYWKITLDYTINDMAHNITENIEVYATPRQRVTSFTGADNVRYIIALIEPSKPAVALNAMQVGLFKMENMMMFPIVDNYSIEIDPRMPSMGNHGSPNNVNLTQHADRFYHGKLSLTMTGYWKINLQLFDQAQELLKGEQVTEDNPASSLYLELEF